MTPDDSRFHSDPDDLVDDGPLPAGWQADSAVDEDLGALTLLLRAHETAARGWAGASREDVWVEISPRGRSTREHLVVRDTHGTPRAWASVHDRAEGRMLYAHIVDPALDTRTADRCSAVLLGWAEAQARAVGEARGLSVQQIDAGAFADDQRQHGWFAAAGFSHVRTWWQMKRPVTPDETSLVASVDRWEEGGVVVRQVELQDDGEPVQDDVRAVHDVLEQAFTDHFNSHEETFDEFVHRVREESGHRWDHWWLAELVDGDEPQPVGALVGEVSPSDDGPDGSYVSYIGVLEAARGRGVAKGLLRTIIADAAGRGRDRVGLEVDADSPTGADGLYTSMGWATSYVTQSWHRDIPLA